ncbi:hypothetical protein T484DRAFT_1920054 [Baffinella frigidus]|nr:hypothetical protein T484DRAFT_1920054 [Cryptophyta sp. CCMP2293]
MRMVGDDAEELMHECMGLLEAPTRRKAVPVLLSDEPFPEHVFVRLSSLERTGSAAGRSPVSASAPLVSPASSRGLSSPLSQRSSKQQSLTAFYHSMKAKFPHVRTSSLDGPPSPLKSHAASSSPTDASSFRRREDPSPLPSRTIRALGRSPSSPLVGAASTRGLPSPPSPLAARGARVQHGRARAARYVDATTRAAALSGAMQV